MPIPKDWTWTVMDGRMPMDKAGALVYLTFVSPRGAPSIVGSMELGIGKPSTAFLLTRALELREELDKAYDYIYGGCRQERKEHAFNGDPGDVHALLTCLGCGATKPMNARLPGVDMTTGRLVVPPGFEHYYPDGAA